MPHMANFFSRVCRIVDAPGSETVIEIAAYREVRTTQLMMRLPL